MMRAYRIKSMVGAKAKAWRWFSKYIRLRDAIETTGTKDRAVCITCGEVHDINKMDAGHAIPGRSNAILFNTQLVNAQCIKCNRYGGGEQQEYKRAMIKKYGLEMWEYWQSEKRKSRGYTVEELEELVQVYKKLYKSFGGN